MAKFYGIIGYATLTETKPGVWEEAITERKYFGDILRNNHRLQASEHLNDNVNVSNQISIVADPFAYENFHTMVYVVFMNAIWKITDVDVQSPRLILTMGGVYNGDET